jgi:Tfp pilus assembly protein PilX
MTTARRRDTGSILIITMVMLIFIFGLTMAIGTIAVTDRTRSSYELDKVAARVRAEAATEFAYAYLQAQAQNGSPITDTYPGVSGGGPLGLRAGSGTVVSPYYYPGTVTLNGVATPFKITLIASQTTPTYQFGKTVTATDGVSSSVYQYSLSSTVTVGVTGGTGNRSASATANRFVEMSATPAFEFAVLFGVDLEIDNGQNLTLSGRVFSNGNMYLSPSATLTFQGSGGGNPFIHTSGNFIDSRGDGTQQGGTVKVASTTWPINNPEDSATSGFDAWATTTFGSNVVMDGNAGVQPIGMPQFSSTANGGFYDTTAQTNGLWIYTNSGATSQTITYNGSSYSVAAGATFIGANGVNQSSNSAYTNAITQTTFFDQRESTNTAGTAATSPMKVTDIDVGSLASNNLLPTNGLVYVSNSLAPTTTNPSPQAGAAYTGFRLKNGATTLNSNNSNQGVGLTVASPLPGYVEATTNGNGGFNTTVDASTGNHPSAAVLADSMTLLSSGWSDAANQSFRTGGPPAATGTNAQNTFNFAMVAGNQQSYSGQYGGGLENFPRFLENWPGSGNVPAVTYNGSFVCEQHSQIANQPWGKNNVYGVPWRLWGFDSNLLSHRPPYTPNAVSITATTYFVSR